MRPHNVETPQTGVQKDKTIDVHVSSARALLEKCNRRHIWLDSTYFVRRALCFDKR
jgi:hypothetical protein